MCAQFQPMFTPWEVANDWLTWSLAMRQQTESPKMTLFAKRVVLGLFDSDQSSGNRAAVD